MRLYHRTSVHPDTALEVADAHFIALEMQIADQGPRHRRYAGALGTLDLTVTLEGGHYVRLDAVTDQVGESRLDKNVKKYFVQVHRLADPHHQSHAAY